MTRRKITNLPASIRQRLQHVAKESGRPFQEVLQYYAMERFLYRLSVSEHADKFVLKGALMLAAWGGAATRPTRDIDLLGFLSNQVDEIAAVMREVCEHEVEPDAVAFDAATVAGVVIKEDADYEGVRITFRGTLGNIRLPMQIDVGFGDIVFPEATLTKYPTILDHEPPRLRGYSRETTVAEKFEAMVKLGLLNSRMKDFYDTWALSQQFDFDGATLATAIESTFANRGTTLPPQPTAFSAAFASDPIKEVQWRAFRRKARLEHAPEDFAAVTERVAAFLLPLVAALTQRQSFTGFWQAPGPEWRESV